MSAPPAIPTLLPALDNSLGALYIGASLATLLYGVICVQTFLYITSIRARSDRRWLKLLVFVVVLVTAHQGFMLAGMYRYLVTDFANPAALEEGGASSGAALSTIASLTIFIAGLLTTLALRQEENITGVCCMLIVQLFFCWRIWTFSASSLNSWMRITFMAITIPLAFLNFASYTALGVFGFQHRLRTPSMPGSQVSLAIKLSASSGMAFDVIVTLAMIISLHCARSGISKSDHVITLLTLFTVNTNLITTFLSVGSLVTFFVLPNATIYGGISFLLANSYLNSFLAILNSRDYLREKLDPSMSIPEAQSSHPVFAEPTSTDTKTEKSFAVLAPADDLSTKV